MWSSCFEARALERMSSRTTDMVGFCRPPTVRSESIASCRTCCAYAVKGARERHGAPAAPVTRLRLPLAHERGDERAVMAVCALYAHAPIKIRTRSDKTGRPNGSRDGVAA